MEAISEKTQPSILISRLVQYTAPNHRYYSCPNQIEHFLSLYYCIRRVLSGSGQLFHRILPATWLRANFPVLNLESLSTSDWPGIAREAEKMCFSKCRSLRVPTKRDRTRRRQRLASETAVQRPLNRDVQDWDRCRVDKRVSRSSVVSEATSSASRQALFQRRSSLNGGLLLSCRLKHCAAHKL